MEAATETRDLATVRAYQTLKVRSALIKAAMDAAPEGLSAEDRVFMTASAAAGMCGLMLGGAKPAMSNFDEIRRLLIDHIDTAIDEGVAIYPDGYREPN